MANIGFYFIISDVKIYKSLHSQKVHLMAQNLFASILRSKSRPKHTRNV